ncbi:MAG: long-chain fatty acid--CoA ligase [Spirulinaceae cyanobacterium SM2_1_0]|nr:long-chain fatty acid--CoA ligase [Spirulinaceae cyanobacterium SM2_1_0]
MSADYSDLTALSQLWPRVAQRYRDTLALHDPHSEPEVRLTYSELAAQIQQFAAGLQALGIEPGNKIALFADNSPRWFIADQGTMAAGAANAVRSGQAERQELLYIFRHSDSQALIAHDLETVNRLQPDLDDLPVRFIILLSDEEPPTEAVLPIFNFVQVMAKGRDATLQPVEQNKATLATLLYTSGTTGQPKGVMLTHGNLLHQVTGVVAVLTPTPGDRALSILPSWHAYERSAEYYLLSRGCTLVYTSIRHFKNDLRHHQPHYMVGVPRLWDSLYEGVQRTFREQPASRQRLVKFFFGISEQYVRARRVATNLDLDRPEPSAGDRFLARLKALLLLPLHGLGDRLVYRKVRAAAGGQLRCVISGGGSLARHLDLFYEIVNIPLLVGYGLTETAPITNARRLARNLRGASGPPLPDTEFRIVDPVTRQALPPRQQGLVLLRGPQVMAGYYKNPDATAKAIDADGWFDSGDLGMRSHGDQLVLTGRAKDTIVLASGENIEPQPIEDACVRSPYIDQIMLVGQDQKQLGALIVPNVDALRQWVTQQGLALKIPDLGAMERGDLDDPAIAKLLRSELVREIKDRPGYRPDDRIGLFYLLLEAFSIEAGTLTQTLKIRRPAITSRYQEIIDGLFGHS